MWNPKRWTPEDDLKMLRMKADGVRNRVIAERLNRTAQAIGARLAAKYPVRPPRKPSVETIPPTTSITHASVPEFYEAGWRFTGFFGGLCQMEWPHATEPRWPADNRKAAA